MIHVDERMFGIVWVLASFVFIIVATLIVNGIAAINSKWAIEAEDEFADRDDPTALLFNTKYTCSTCTGSGFCPYSYDGYNTDGDCLMDK
jgi:hypothetical protein